MSFYRSGLGAKTSWFPSAGEPLRNQFGEIVAGVRMVKTGAPRMYEVGASEKQEPLAPGFAGVVGWIDDLGKTLLVLGGILVAASALRGAKNV